MVRLMVEPSFHTAAQINELLSVFVKRQTDERGSFFKARNNIVIRALPDSHIGILHPNGYKIVKIRRYADIYNPLYEMDAISLLDLFFE